MNGGGSNDKQTFVFSSQPGKDLEPVTRNERRDRDIVSSERACRAIKVRDHVGRTHGTRKRLGEDCFIVHRFRSVVSEPMLEREIA